MKTVKGIPKTAKHPTKKVKGPTKKGEKAMSGIDIGVVCRRKKDTGPTRGAAVEGLPDILGDMAFLCLMI